MQPEDQSIDAKLDRILVCLEGRPLQGEIGLVGRVSRVEHRLKTRAKIESRIVKATGLSFLAAFGAWLWTFIAGKHL